MNGYNGTFELVDPRTIIFDRHYQRQAKKLLIQQIATSPSWEAFGVPVCFKRSNGMLYCADGQQRISGVLQSARPPKLVPVVWFDIGDDVADEASVFGMINEWRKALQPLEKHKAKIVAGDEAALAMERAVAQAGYTIDYGSGSGSANARTIQAVAALAWIYNRIGEEGVLQTLTCIRESWPNDETGPKRHYLRGVAELIEEQGTNYNRARLIAALKKASPSDVVAKADELRFRFGGSKLTKMRAAFADLCGLKEPREQKKRTAA